jgi:predicted dithiol-disulfide oxidoreductase (DUF899 family)
MTQHEIVSRERWLAASRALLAEEKAWTRARDRLNEMRQDLPWVRIDQDYIFDSEDGPVNLAALFENRSQLAVYHFMFAPDWQEGCTGCSLLCDQVDGPRQHFEQNGVSFAAIARAPIEKLQAYRKRMGWKFSFVSSGRNSFNADFNVSFPGAAEVFYNFETQPHPGIDDMPGVSVFFKDTDGSIYHTYSNFSRGNEILLGVYGWLDMVPNGRNEPKGGNLMDWAKRHDQYQTTNTAPACAHHA